MLRAEISSVQANIPVLFLQAETARQEIPAGTGVIHPGTWAFGEFSARAAPFSSQGVLSPHRQGLSPAAEPLFCTGVIKNTRLSCQSGSEELNLISIGSETAAMSFKARMQNIFSFFTSFFLIDLFYGKLDHEKIFYICTKNGMFIF